MKKILVVLLVFAVAGGVFAQESPWSVSANAKLSTVVDLEKTDATIGLGNWGDGRGDGDVSSEGNLNLTYKREAITVNLDFGIKPSSWSSNQGQADGSINGAVGFENDRYRFFVKAPIVRMLMGSNDASYYMGSDGNNYLFGGGLDKLWGYVDLMNKMIRLEASYKGRDNGWWKSNDTAGGGWANMDGKGAVLTNININNIDFGLMIPNIFPNNIGDAKNVPVSYEFVDDALLQSIFGVKFVMAPIDFAAQFLFKDYGVYVGAQYKTGGPVTVGASFQGTLSPSDGSKPPIMAGAKVEYTNDAFSASVAAKFGMNGKAGDLIGDPYVTDLTTAGIGIEPTFWYNVLPDSLRFRVDAGFYFRDTAVVWKFAPQITYNFLGTGAGGWDTGVGIKYSIRSKANGVTGSGEYNALSLAFKWKI